MATAPSPFEPPTRFVVLYDGDCGLCRWSVQWLKAHDPNDLVKALPLQTPGLLDSLGVDREIAMREVQVITRTGERWSGSDALLNALAGLPGSGWLRVLLWLPLVRWIARPIYRAIARRRSGETCPGGVCHL